MNPLPLTVVAVGLYGALFAAQRAAAVDFWAALSINAVLLNGIALLADAEFRRNFALDLRSHVARKVVAGLASAVVLYAIFAAGNVASRAIFPFAAGGIDSVYRLKEGESVLRVCLLMTFVIGPGEELFWRGYLQRAWAGRLGAGRGYLLAAALYTGIHAGSANPMLILAAAVCGLFWGALYWNRGSAFLNIISHTAWDLAVFLLFPFSG